MILHSIRQLGLLIAICTLAACSSAPKTTNNPCLKRRGAIDIGSGSTKAYAAVVDICQNPKRIVEKFFDQKLKISFGEALERNPNGVIPDDLAASAAVQIATLTEDMVTEEVDDISLIATAAFRKAKNGEAVAQTISQAINVRLQPLAKKTALPVSDLRVQILPQRDEAEIGAASALTNLSKPPAANHPVVVWDIGGGSMQMLSLNGSKEIFTGDLASVGFKNRVIREVHKKDPAKISSPNPLGTANISKAVAIAREHATQYVPKHFRTMGPVATWVGIGGVLASSVQKQVEKETDNPYADRQFTQVVLAKTLQARAGKKDEEIESDYRNTEVTNLALVLGYMRALKIDTVETVEASLVQGLITR